MSSKDKLIEFLTYLNDFSQDNSPINGDKVIGFGNIAFGIKESGYMVNNTARLGYIKVIDGKYVITEKGFQLIKKHPIIDFTNRYGNIILITISIITLGLTFYSIFKPSLNGIFRKSTQRPIPSITTQ